MAVYMMNVKFKAEGGFANLYLVLILFYFTNYNTLNQNISLSVGRKLRKLFKSNSHH